jgi:hypothetical protein
MSTTTMERGAAAAASVISVERLSRQCRGRGRNGDYHHRQPAI